MRYKFQKSHNFKQRTKRRVVGRPGVVLRVMQKLCALSALMAAGFIVYPWDLHQEFIAIKDEIPNRFGFLIKDITIEGNERLSTEEIRAMVAANPGDQLYKTPINDLREQIESHPWVASVIVERVLPSTLRIIVREEKPQAVYINDDECFFVNKGGKLIEKIEDVMAGESYIYLRGKNANQGYYQVLDEIYESEPIYNRLEGLNRISERRWDIILEDNVTIKLPARDIIAALEKFSELLADDIDLFNKGCIIDLRFMPEKIYIKY